MEKLCNCPLASPNHTGLPSVSAAGPFQVSRRSALPILPPRPPLLFEIIALKDLNYYQYQVTLSCTCVLASIGQVPTSETARKSGAPRNKLER
jgi:hypothetical protein